MLFQLNSKSLNIFKNCKMEKYRNILILTILLISMPAFSIFGQKPVIKREITLYNPYKPSLPDVTKKSFLPDMTDTFRIKTEFKYEIKTSRYTPTYAISPLKPATMVPDPLNKLYNSFIKLGFGSHVTPTAELSITNLRSKKGAIGFYAGHFSANGKVKLENQKKVFAGYMDNNASLYGRKFFSESVLDGSIDFSQNTRYAYGYDTLFSDYNPSKKDIKLNYYSFGANIGLNSVKTDSTELAYNVKLNYNYFTSHKDFYQNNIRLDGIASKEWKGFYVGSGLEFDLYKPSGIVSNSSRYLVSLMPFVKKNSNEWDVKLGADILLDRNLNDNAKLRIYPDLRFAFNIIPASLGFFTELNGKLEKNTAGEIININPYIIPGDILYKIRGTSYPLIVKAGFSGETGIEGYYRLFASYSISDNLVLFSNYFFRNFLTPDSIPIYIGNYFLPLYDDTEIFNLHGEMAGKIGSRLNFYTEANYFKYTLTNNQSAWGRPDWDAEFTIKYNLRDKILASITANAIGKRKMLQTVNSVEFRVINDKVINMPAHINFNLEAEYRYTKILSFWMRLNNISFSRYYEWAWYPSYRFIFQAGFTYSL